VIWEISVSMHEEEGAIDKPYHDATKPSLYRVRVSMHIALMGQNSQTYLAIKWPFKVDSHNDDNEGAETQ
jgi:hypothetical protein